MRGNDWKREWRAAHPTLRPLSKIEWVSWFALRLINGSLRIAAWFLLLFFWTGNRPLTALACSAAMFTAVWASGHLLQPLDARLRGKP